MTKSVKVFGAITAIVVGLCVGIIGTDIERNNNPLYTYAPSSTNIIPPTSSSSNKIEEVKSVDGEAIPTYAPVISVSSTEDQSDSITSNVDDSETKEVKLETEVEKSTYVGSQDLRFSYMDWRTITDQTSDQWKLQNWYSVTDWSTGIRTVNGRYSVAVGSSVSVEKGKYINVYLENGIMIPCVISDTKADFDTWNNNGLIGNDGSVIEFIVDTDVMSAIDIGNVTVMGDYKYLSNDWNSPVDHIDVLTYVQDIG